MELDLLFITLWYLFEIMNIPIWKYYTKYTNTYSVIPLFIAAVTFYLIPPTGSTCPVKLISPVIAKFSLGFRSRRREVKQVAIVTPADGPSFLTDPSGK